MTYFRRSKILRMSRCPMFGLLLIGQFLLTSGAVLKTSSSSSSSSSSSPTTTTATTLSSVRVEGDDEADEDDDEARISQLWLDDFDTEFNANEADETMLSDTPQMLGDESVEPGKRDAEEEEAACPPPPRQLPPFSCEVTQCVSDKECSSDTLCCYNGCKYTCMAPVQPPPYVDWKRQPQRRLVAGSSWLVVGPDEEEGAVEWCSTSEVFGEDEDPLLCPQGYFCFIEDPGDPVNAVPNRGRCVRKFSEVAMEFDNSEDVDCHIGQKIYANGTSFVFDRHTCECRLGSVLCRVGRSKKVV